LDINTIKEEGCTPEEALIVSAMMKDLPTREEYKAAHESCDHRFKTKDNGWECRKCGTFV